MFDDYNHARSMANLTIRKKYKDVDGQLTPSMIKEAVESVVASGLADLDAAGAARLVAELETSFETFVGRARSLKNSNTYRPWLAKRKAELSWRFWERYRTLLIEGGWPVPVVDKIGEFTDTILDHLVDPAAGGSWGRRGLVVGHVQSGKTANYTGVICKAADAGYRVIVVLAGMHKSLRTQTQIRLEDGFLGYRTPGSNKDVATRPRIGVGLIDPLPRAHYVTTRADGGDFRKTFARQLGIGFSEKPLLFVVKKNGSVLKNLVEWVASMSNHTDEDGRAYVAGVPLLVIDDEADQGSIDTKAKSRDEDGNVDEEHDPTVLNQRIRALLNSFDQSAYLAYTATPFANILIHDGDRTKQDGDDLFPRDFIVSLPAPSNYVGPVRVFGLGESGAAPLPIIRRILDCAASDKLGEEAGWIPPSHKKEHKPLFRGEERVPDSLATAIRAFVLSCAARSARGDEAKHKSMLIHVTRFTAVQEHVASQVKEELQRLATRIRLEPEPDGVLAGLKRLWEEDFVPAAREIDADDCRPLTWVEVERNLWTAVSAIKVLQINGRAGDVLEYELNEAAGLSVIAVGGDKLSRGLTLEGLSVSYFLRASRMYDTLMQMGRWFGYRPKYVDLCRIFTTTELTSWFEHITRANEKLRDEFNMMSAAHQTPTEYGQKVLSHPELLVTSHVKMRDAQEVAVAFAGSISETIIFYRDETRIERNFDALKRLVRAMGGTDGAQNEPVRGAGAGNRLLWRGVSADDVRGLLGDYSPHADARKVNTVLMARYIEEQGQAHDELKTWTVALLGGKGAPNDALAELVGGTIDPVVRSWHGEDRSDKALDFRIRRLVSPTDETLDLTQEQYNDAMLLTKQQYTPDAARQNRKTPTVPSGLAIREIRSSREGLLLIYPISPVLEGTKKTPKPTNPARAGAAGPPLLGVAVSFPGTKNAATVTYRVNSVYAAQEFGS